MTAPCVALIGTTLTDLDGALDDDGSAAVKLKRGLGQLEALDSILEE